MVPHWVKEMVDRAGRQDGRGQEGRHQNSLFYAYDGVVAPSDLGWLHGVFQHPGGSVRSGGSEGKFRGDGRNGLTSLSFRGHPVGGGVRAADSRHSIIMPGEAASQGAVFVVWGVDGVGVAGSPSIDADRGEIDGETELEGYGSRRRATNLQDVFTNHRVPEGLSRRGVPGTGRNTEGEAVPLPTPSYVGHRDHTGGGKPPPPPTPPV